MATDRNDALLQELSGQLGDIAGLLGEIRDRLPASDAGSPEPADAPDPDAEILLEEPATPNIAPDVELLTEPTIPARRSARKTAPRRAPKTEEAP